MKYILAADIGGTYSRVALFTQTGVRKVYHRFENARYPSVTALLHDFRMRHAVQLSKASVAVAAPVQDGDAKMPNLSWHVSEDLLKHALLVKDVRLHNDAYAAAVGLERVPSVRVKSGHADAQGTRAILAPGTGLGSSFIVCAGAKRMPHPAEAGHADFAPVTDLHAQLRDFMKGRHAHVSNERILSGPGLVALYYFLRQQRVANESNEQRAAIDSAYSPGHAIVDAALAGTSGVAVRAVEEFASILASYASNYALSVYATGGIYLYGSLTSRILPFLKSTSFEHAFNKKGRMTSFCSRIPVFVVRDPDVVLTGAFLLSKH